MENKGSKGKKMIIDIDNTRRATMVGCPRKYAYRWNSGLVPDKGNASFRYGGVIHAGLESYYNCLQAGEDRSPVSLLTLDNIEGDMRTEWKIRTGGFEFDEDFRTFTNAWNCVYRYILEQEKTTAKPLDVLDVELPLTIPLPLDRAERVISPAVLSEIETINFIGRIDGVVNRNGQIYALEHKTTTLPMASAERLLDRSAQTRGYTWALRQLFENDKSPARPVGALVNILRTPGRRKKKDGTFTEIKLEEFEFARVPLVYSEADLNGWLDSMLYRAGQIAECTLSGVWPQEFDNCQAFAHPCEYTKLCEQCKPDNAALNTSGFVEHRWDPRD